MSDNVVGTNFIAKAKYHAIFRNGYTSAQDGWYKDLSREFARRGAQAGRAGRDIEEAWEETWDELAIEHNAVVAGRNLGGGGLPDFVPESGGNEDEESVIDTPEEPNNEDGEGVLPDGGDDPDEMDEPDDEDGDESGAPDDQDVDMSYEMGGEHANVGVFAGGDTHPFGMERESEDFFGGI